MARYLSGGIGIILLSVFAATSSMGADQEPTEDKPTAADRYLELGTEEGVLGGEEQQAFERSQIKVQIKTFIPPLLRPAFTQHAFVLPPHAY